MIEVGGKEVSASDIDLKADSIYSNVEGMDVDVANEMISAYKGYGAEIDTKTFAADWKLAYQMGLANRNADSTDFTSYGFKISSEAAEAARAFGQAEYRGESTSRKSKIKEAQKKKTGREGTISTDKVLNKKRITDGAMRTAKVLSIAGYNIEFFEDISETADRGSYSWDTNTIRINVAVGTGRGGIDYVLGRTLSHELTHSIQRWNPEGYEELKGFIIEKMGDSFEGMVSRKMKRLGLSYDGAVDEVIADGCEMMLKNSKSLTEFADKHRTVFEKICDVVEEFINGIRSAIYSLYGESGALHDEARFMELYADELQKVFDKVLSETLEISEATVDHGVQSNANKKAAEDGGDGTYRDLINNGEKSKSGHIYKKGRKPTKNAYMKGLENFFKPGEKRLAPTKDGGYILEVWDGKGWIKYETHSRDVGGRVQKSVAESYSEYNKPITFEDVKLLRSIIGAHNGQRVSINDFTSEDIQKAQKWAYKFYKELGVKSPFFRAWFGDWRAYDDNTDVYFVDTKQDNRGSVVNDYTGWNIQTSKKVHKETSHHSGSPEVTAVKYLPYIDDITKKAVLFDSIISDKENENSLMFHTMYAYTEVLGYPALLKIKVEELFYHNRETSGILKRDYILQNIEEESISKRNRFSRPNHSETNSSNMSISDLFALVKEYDKEFKPKEASAIRNADGTPQIMYHGTKAENGEFWEFDYSKAKRKGCLGLRAMGKGNYFTSIELDTNGKYDRVIAAYLDIKKPFEYQGGRALSEQISEKLGIETTEMDYDALQQVLRNAGYDGVVQYDKNGEISIAVTFDSEQIKSATDNIGTFDRGQKDIRYSRGEGYNAEVKTVTPEEEADIAEYREARGISLTEALKLTCETEEERAKIAEYEENEKKLNKMRADRAQYEFDRNKLFENEPYSPKTEEIRQAHRDAVKLRKAIRSLERARKAVREKLTGQEYIILDDQAEKAVRKKAKAEIAKERSFRRNI